MKFKTMLLATALAGVLAGAAQAQTAVKLGVLNDRSGVYADLSGEGSVIAARMAVDDFKAADKGIKVSATHVYGIKAQGKAKQRKQKREKVMAVKRSVNGDPVELLRGIKDLAARSGGIRHLKELVDVLAD